MPKHVKTTYSIFMLSILCRVGVGFVSGKLTLASTYSWKDHSHLCDMNISNCAVMFYYMFQLYWSQSSHTFFKTCHWKVLNIRHLSTCAMFIEWFTLISSQFNVFPHQLAQKMLSCHVRTALNNAHNIFNSNIISMIGIHHTEHEFI